MNRFENRLGLFGPGLKRGHAYTKVIASTQERVAHLLNQPPHIAAFGLQAVPEESVQRDVVDAAERAAPVTPPPAAPRRPAQPKGTVRAAPPAPAAPSAVPVYVAPAPVYVAPAPVYVAPPAPVYVPPPAPVYVPPAAPPVVMPVPEPRLRDRIIEKIPLINRFHEPKYAG